MKEDARPHMRDAQGCTVTGNMEEGGSGGEREGDAGAVEKERERMGAVKSRSGMVFALFMVYFGTQNMFITLWFGLDYGTNPPLGTLII
jgi:hypothetical protein